MNAIQIFEQAIGLAPRQISAFLDEQCGGDAELRREVEALLETHKESASLFKTSESQDDSTGDIDANPERRAERKYSPGQVLLDRYAIVETIGAGGMGEVYRAQDAVLGRDVAIKTLRTVQGSDHELQERFHSRA